MTNFQSVIVSDNEAYVGLGPNFEYLLGAITHHFIPDTLSALKSSINSWATYEEFSIFGPFFGP